MRKLGTFVVLMLLTCVPAAFANTPGRRAVTLTWTASTSSGVSYNLYRGTAAGVCSGTPTPYQPGIATTSFIDTNVTLGTTYFYNVSAVGSGGESTCDGEVQVPVPNITTTPPTNMQGSAQ